MSICVFAKKNLSVSQINLRLHVYKLPIIHTKITGNKRNKLQKPIRRLHSSPGWSGTRKQITGEAVATLQVKSLSLTVIENEIQKFG